MTQTLSSALCRLGDVPSRVRQEPDAGPPVRIDLGTLLLHAGASTRVDVVRRNAADAGLAVVALGSVRSETVGDAYAAGELPRRSVAGIELRTPGGDTITAGGRTGKDVVGYDLAGLALGSGERLGTVTAVSLRLEPSAARTPAESGPGRWRGDGGVPLEAAFSSGR